MGRRGSLAEGFDALAGAARAVREIHATRDQSRRSATVAQLSLAVRRIESQLAKAEESFAAMSSFCQQTVSKIQQLEQKIENIYLERVGGSRDAG